MSFKDAVRIGVVGDLAGLRQLLEGMTPQELRWQATPTSNHITWILWHMARSEDWLGVRAFDFDSVWVSGEWASKFGFGEDDDEAGGGWTIEQVIAMPDVPISSLLDYYSQVRERTVAEFEKFTDDDMARVYRLYPRWELTGADIYNRIVMDRSAHVGQIMFIRGMQRGLEGMDERTREWFSEIRRS